MIVAVVVGSVDAGSDGVVFVGISIVDKLMLSQYLDIQGPYQREARKLNTCTRAAILVLRLVPVWNLSFCFYFAKIPIFSY